MNKYFLLLFLVVFPLSGMDSFNTTSQLTNILEDLHSWEQKYDQVDQQPSAIPEHPHQDLALELSDKITKLKESIFSDDLPLQALDQLVPIACKVGSLNLVQLLIYNGIPYKRILGQGLNSTDQFSLCIDGNKTISDYVALVKLDVERFIKNPVAFESQFLSKACLIKQLYYGASYGMDDFQSNAAIFVSTCKQLVSHDKSNELENVLKQLEKKDWNKDRRTMLMAVKLLKAQQTQPVAWKL